AWIRRIAVGVIARAASSAEAMDWPAEIRSRAARTEISTLASPDARAAYPSAWRSGTPLSSSVASDADPRAVVAARRMSPSNGIYRSTPCHAAHRRGDPRSGFTRPRDPDHQRRDLDRGVGQRAGQVAPFAHGLLERGERRTPARRRQLLERHQHTRYGESGLQQVGENAQPER